ncbi:hypothetical protein A2Z23_01425 [Candidatus Curtissbacteria bacterium RBG_16_39_7]|uniref:NodB homology domain-containing protein n=1 Tax=Candidatus Curtissbacteria bacterium RBG_16_39_7 TaxID=1797707 RepID=A0A1F5G520_9BACT|nr:MAG: hypothetical protein A2Z23_01425 [Candidatus Curtissbacteria bacterium RBG_16_39_7]
MTKLLLPSSLLVLAILIFITISRYSNFSYQVITPKPAPQQPKNFGEVIEKNTTADITKKQTQFDFQSKLSQSLSINVPILTYHYIGANPNPADKARNSLSVDPFQFEQELEWLSQNGYQSITLEDLYENLTSLKELPPKPIILTFDDGYIDFYYNAYPILRKYNFSAVSFIPTGFVGRPGYMTWSMVEEISTRGGVEFESHGVNHKDLASLSEQELVRELEDSKKVLEEKTGRPVDFLAYPYGGFNQRVVQIVRKTGYKSAVSTISGEKQMGDELFALRRIRVPGMPTLVAFTARLRQAS